MKKLLLLVLLVSSERLLSSANTDLFACLRRTHQVVPLGGRILQASKAIAAEDEIDGLVQRYVCSNTELRSLQLKGRKFHCLEIGDHNQTCACFGNRFVSVQDLIKKKVLGNPGIMQFKVDLDEQGLAGTDHFEEDEQLYGVSKAYPFVLFKMDEICERYHDAIERERQIIRQEKKEQKVLLREMKNRRKEFLKKGVVATMCECACRLHKSCFDKMVSAGYNKCIKCQDDLSRVLKESACNFVFPNAQDGSLGMPCPKCKRLLWNFKR